MTYNDEEATARVTAAFEAEFGEVADYGRQTASEDFSAIPDAFGAPYVYWGFGGTDPETYAEAEDAGAVATTIPANHSPFFAPQIEPTLGVGVRALVAATLAYLAPGR